MADGLLQVQVGLDDQITDSLVDEEAVTLPAVAIIRRGCAHFLTMEERGTARDIITARHLADIQCLCGQLFCCGRARDRCLIFAAAIENASTLLYYSF